MNRTMPPESLSRRIERTPGLRRLGELNENMLQDENEKLKRKLMRVQEEMRRLTETNRSQETQIERSVDMSMGLKQEIEFLNEENDALKRTNDLMNDDVKRLSEAMESQRREMRYLKLIHLNVISTHCRNRKIK